MGSPGLFIASAEVRRFLNHPSVYQTIIDERGIGCVFRSTFSHRGGIPGVSATATTPPDTVSPEHDGNS